MLGFKPVHHVPLNRLTLMIHSFIDLNESIYLEAFIPEMKIDFNIFLDKFDHLSILDCDYSFDSTMEMNISNKIKEFQSMVKLKNHLAKKDKHINSDIELPYSYELTPPFDFTRAHTTYEFKI